MDRKSLKGLVILMTPKKELIQTKKVRIYQRENLVDKLYFLIPLSYDDISLESYSITLQYLDTGGTVHAESLVRLTNDSDGYENYVDANDIETHMIYTIDVDSKLTQFSGDLTIKLTMDYIDYEGQTASLNDTEEAADPEPVHHVLNTDTTILSVLPIADYYSVVSDESMSFINKKFAEIEAEQRKLDAKQKELEETAEIYDKTKADNIVLHVDKYGQSIYLTSNGHKVGDEIDLNTLGEELASWTESGLVKVITEDDDPDPSPEPTPVEKADDIVLVINENTKAIYLLSNGHRIGTPIYLDDLGNSLAEFTTDGLIKVITDEDGNEVITGD